MSAVMILEPYLLMGGSLRSFSSEAAGVVAAAVAGVVVVGSVSGVEVAAAFAVVVASLALYASDSWTCYFVSVAFPTAAAAS